MTENHCNAKVIKWQIRYVRDASENKTNHLNSAETVENHLKEKKEDNLKTCPECGGKINKNDKFCMFCGSKNTQDINICSRYKSPVSSDDRFCSNCGFMLKKS